VRFLQERYGVRLGQDLLLISTIEQQVLLCIVAQSEVGALKALIERVDPQAFVIISEAAEVLGEGFKTKRRH
jgi:uncharacterized membrane-anchored protein YitT (DUF2179 family)